MDNEYDELIQRLTARYVAEHRAGLHPQLSVYLTHYPQYADILADFVIYYHAMEAELPLESEIIAPLSQTSRAAYDEAIEKMIYATPELGGKQGSLQMAASNSQKSLEQVSVEVGLDQDILQKLDQHSIDVTTIPRELSRRLARALHQPVTALEILLGMDQQEQRFQLVAEHKPDYHVEDQSALQEHVYSFQEAIEQSKHMSDEHKGDWRAVLLHEGLS